MPKHIADSKNRTNPLQMAARDESVNKMIEIYEQPLKNSIIESSDYALQPVHVKTPLRPHQLAMINAMYKKEEQCVNGFDLSGEKHYSQMAILGDKVGSGKTLMMLGYLSHLKANPLNNVFSRIHSLSRSAFWSQKPVYTPECSGNTLIIVPHTLFHQWKHAVQQQTTLSFFEVKTTKALEKPDFLSLIKTRDVTLMSNTIIRQYMSEASRENIHWSRVIFDEVDSIHFTSTVSMPPSNFYWLITATWPNFIFQGLYMYMTETYLARLAARGLHQDLITLLHEDQTTNVNNYYTRYDIRSGPFFSDFLSKHPSRGHLVLRTSSAFMEQSWKTPPIHDERIICESPVSHRIIAQYVNAEIQDLLHAGDVQTALEKLGVSGTSQSSLISALCETREKELDRLEKTYTFKESMTYATPLAKEQALASLKIKITSLKEQIASLKERITNMKEEICAICFEEPNTPTIVLCCSRLFCGACIINCIQRNPSCPLCRSSLGYQNLRQIDNSDNSDNSKKSKKQKDEIIVDKKPKKKEALLNLISSNPGSRFLIFNRYDNPFLEIEGELLQRSIRVATVKGNKDHVSSILKQFEKGEIQVLLMNSTQAGAGMDLKSATHIVLMHAMRKEEEKQIVGRAIRLGRTEPLKLVRLLHESEQSITAPPTV
jgi:SNF2 family DNA or RNA helicase